LVVAERTTPKAMSTTIAAATQRPGRRTGTAFISLRSVAGRPGQLVAPLIVGFLIAPAWMPHFFRIEV
jgi:hypothetical protein